MCYWITRHSTKLLDVSGRALGIGSRHTSLQSVSLNRLMSIAYYIVLCLSLTANLVKKYEQQFIFLILFRHDVTLSKYIYTYA